MKANVVAAIGCAALLAGLPAEAAVPNNAVPNNAVPNNAVPNNAVPNNAVPNNGANLQAFEQGLLFSNNPIQQALVNNALTGINLMNPNSDIFKMWSDPTGYSQLLMSYIWSNAKRPDDNLYACPADYTDGAMPNFCEGSAEECAASTPSGACQGSTNGIPNVGYEFYGIIGLCDYSPSVSTLQGWSVNQPLLTDVACQHYESALLASENNNHVPPVHNQYSARGPTVPGSWPVFTLDPALGVIGTQMTSMGSAIPAFQYFFGTETSVPSVTNACTPGTAVTPGSFGSAPCGWTSAFDGVCSPYDVFSVQMSNNTQIPMVAMVNQGIHANDYTCTSAACSPANLIASSIAPQTTQPTMHFVCPASGTYNIQWAPYSRDDIPTVQAWPAAHPGMGTGISFNAATLVQGFSAAPFSYYPAFELDIFHFREGFFAGNMFDIPGEGNRGSILTSCDTRVNAVVCGCPQCFSPAARSCDANILGCCAPGCVRSGITVYSQTSTTGTGPHPTTGVVATLGLSITNQVPIDLWVIFQNTTGGDVSMDTVEVAAAVVNQSTLSFYNTVNFQGAFLVPGTTLLGSATIPANATAADPTTCTTNTNCLQQIVFSPAIDLPPGAAVALQILAPGTTPADIAVIGDTTGTIGDAFLPGNPQLPLPYWDGYYEVGNFTLFAEDTGAPYLIVSGNPPLQTPTVAFPNLHGWFSSQFGGSAYAQERSCYENNSSCLYNYEGVLETQCNQPVQLLPPEGPTSLNLNADTGGSGRALNDVGMCTTATSGPLLFNDGAGTYPSYGVTSFFAQYGAGIDGIPPNSVDCTVDQPPTATAVARNSTGQTSTQFCAGETVYLDATGSSDPEQNPLSFAWTDLGDTPTPFPPPLSGMQTSFNSAHSAGQSLSIQLTASDPCNQVGTAQVNVTIKSTTHTPVAVASILNGNGSAVAPLSPVTLDGTGSYDPAGDPLTYYWVQTAGVGVPILGFTTPRPSFYAPPPGVSGPLTFELIVTDSAANNSCGGPLSAVATVSVNITGNNTPPVANAGSPQSICASGTGPWSLNGSATDPDGFTITGYQWAETDNPELATLTNATVANASFTLDAPLTGNSETLNFSLTATDSASMTSTPSPTTVTLWRQAPAPTISLRGGSASSGSPALAALSGTTPHLSALSTQFVVIDASQSSDSEGTLGFQWQELSSSSPGILSLSGTSSATLSFQTPVALTDDTTGLLMYQFLLTVTDTPPSNDACTGTVSTTTVVTVYVDEPPVAHGTATQATVCGGQPITLNGNTSSDPNSSAITSYSWTQLANPMLSQSIGPLSGETVTFTAPTLATATTLSFALKVSDALGLQSINTDDVVSVNVKDVNEAPIANAGANQLVIQGATVTLNGSGSHDPDGDPLTYSWKQTGGPSVCLTNSNPNCGCLSTSNLANPSFRAPQLSQCGNAKTQALTFQLTVTDQPSSSECGGPLCSGPSTVTVTIEAPDHPPVANAGYPLTVNDGALVQLDGSQSYDPDGDPLTYKWTQLSGPAATLSNATAVRPTFTAPSVATGTSQALVFQLTVTDPSALSSSANVTITDKGVLAPPNCSGAYASISQLWPPSHQLFNVTILGVKDPSDQNVFITVTSISQDEPTSGTCRGDTDPDGVINSDGSCFLRGERGDSTGDRTYYIDFKATDRYGNYCTGEVTVGAPQNSGGSCGNRGRLYDSTR